MCSGAFSLARQAFEAICNATPAIGGIMIVQVNTPLRTHSCPEDGTPSHSIKGICSQALRLNFMRLHGYDNLPTTLRCTVDSSFMNTNVIVYMAMYKNLLQHLFVVKIQPGDAGAENFVRHSPGTREAKATHAFASWQDSRHLRRRGESQSWGQLMVGAQRRRPRGQSAHRIFDSATGACCGGYAGPDKSTWHSLLRNHKQRSACLHSAAV